jgi:3'-phosphoadenosine 5'-phosphosulfate sulfotransferase
VTSPWDDAAWKAKQGKPDEIWRQQDYDKMVQLGRFAQMTPSQIKQLKQFVALSQREELKQKNL